MKIMQFLIPSIFNNVIALFFFSQSDVVIMYVTNINDNRPIFMNEQPYIEDVFEVLYFVSCNFHIIYSV